LFDTPASLVKSLASLLVVVTGSAIGREGAMILLAALAASLFARRFTPQVNGSCGSPAAPPPGWPAPIMPRWPAACLSLKFSLAR
jgi:CIC family chloride channel protein